MCLLPVCLFTGQCVYSLFMVHDCLQCVCLQCVFVYNVCLFAVFLFIVCLFKVFLSIELLCLFIVC